ncbi:MAG: sigma-70 family RNA polymerase sigma factor [Bacillota bacterium]|uniref:Sigma-70 family RNA polymerase sigma factor n=1 Tax=Virgibacillus salarius TaxID=447199 RepID=A0A941DU31_9BACI|nr:MULTISPECIES: sigma-70 family RNA polymerase sigma factor [Bacillaceae]NAZ09953.1 sigma-70 family RNA polymerase sigma factor [Agaribacter marinus]MBR7797244.1 sigma-70 family RNA polymerase sigma factor [Virgibacillus salarius]MCC2250142.1 sigma-70 family RNA polymerase sigma factor [Virgibacillus sp. AGTR]QRZ19025.1 sigma-70 family RNA polymerase sigma factor [Virgibacillus sp. AGTR]WBX81351.1 sigma-70 family RNA polymerase sigma factor [Virgibacillus salarius]
MDIQDLYKLYILDVYRYLFSLCKDKELAEDLTHDTFMKAYIALDRSPPKSFKAWLFKIAYHLFIDYMRHSKRIVYQEPEFFSKIAHDQSTELDFLKHLHIRELYRKLDQLKPLQRDAILLCDIQGYSYKEAATILSVKENTLKSHIFRGRGRLRQLYKKGE